MSGTFIDSLRAAADNGLGVVAAKQLNAFTVNLVIITNDQINFDDSPSTRVRTNVPIFVGQAVGSNLYPHVQYMEKQDKNQTLVLSGAALTDMELVMGPLAFPYDTGYQTGGFDPSNFQPGPSSNSSTQIYVWLQGDGLNAANGNYYKVKEIALAGLDNVTYYVRLESISDVIPS